MLDAVDLRKNLLVCAPTSGGKTFVSYYAIKNILESNAAGKDKGRVVFVVPTKALVNQTSGDLYARYGRKFAVFTREQKDADIESKEILITGMHQYNNASPSSLRDHVDFPFL